MTHIRQTTAMHPDISMTQDEATETMVARSSSTPLRDKTVK